VLTIDEKKAYAKAVLNAVTGSLLKRPAEVKQDSATPHRPVSGLQKTDWQKGKA